LLFSDKQERGSIGEIQLTDAAIQKLNQIQRLFTYEFWVKRYNVDERIQFVKTMIEFLLQYRGLKHDILNYLKELIEKEIVKNKLQV